MTIKIEGASIRLVRDASLVQNANTPYDVEFIFNEEWAGFAKTARFEAGGVSAAVALTDNRCAIPAECLNEGGVWLRVAIVGVKENQRISTGWCVTGMILHKTSLDLGQSVSLKNPQISFYVTLPTANWSNRTQTVKHEYFLANNNHWYVVCGDTGVKADNVTTNGEITFHCEMLPEKDLTVNILRLEAET